MSGGALLQLIAFGKQDYYFVGNPSVSFFKLIYRQYTPFAIQCMEVPIGQVKPGSDTSTEIPRSADGLGKSYLKIPLPELKADSSSFDGKVAWIKRLGHFITEHYTCKIGGNDIVKFYGTYSDVWYEVTHTADKELGYRKLICDTEEMTTLATSIPKGNIVYMPFLFWFCRNWGLLLLLLALQYHPVRFDIKFQNIDRLIVYSLGPSKVVPTFNNIEYTNVNLLLDYVFLDQMERKKMAQNSHEYLIRQLQHYSGNVNGSAGEATTFDTRLVFNQPHDEVIWCYRNGLFNGKNMYKFLGYTSSDAPNAWDVEIANAASRLAKNMINVADTVGATGSQLVTITNGDATKVVTVGNTTFAFTISDWGTYTTNPAAFSIIMAPLSTATFNLADRLQYVSVRMHASGDDGTNTTMTIDNVTAMQQNMTLIDLSTPVSYYTDRRVSSEGDVRVTDLTNYGLLLDGTGNILVEGNLVFDGTPRFNIQPYQYFNNIQPYEVHTRTPKDGIYVYSFSLHPEQHQPSGVANFSRFDSKEIHQTLSDPFSKRRSVPVDIYKNTIQEVFGNSRNILREVTGMGGVVYAG